MKINIDERISYILNLLNEYGEAYLVGGALRDLLLGIEPKDYDIATNLLLGDLLHILNDFNPIIKSESYQVITISYENIKIDIARFRKDKGILDGRNPQSIEFVEDILEDLKRRDFTVNSMAYNNKKGLIDIFNSYEDIKNKKIRVTYNDVETKFKEDYSRILRAFILMSKYDFTLDDDYKKIIKKLMFENKINISNNLLIKLLEQILFNPYAYKSIDNMFKLNILHRIVPEMSINILGENIVNDIVNTYKIYCKYKAYEEKTIGYAILFIYLGKIKNKKDYLLDSITISDTGLKKLGVSLNDAILIKNLIYYSKVIYRSINKNFIKKMLFKFRNNKNLSKLLNLISFINYNSKDYTNSVKSTLELLNRIQSIYFNDELVYINDLDINIVDLYNLGLDTNISMESIREDIFRQINDVKLINKKDAIIEYVIRKYNLNTKIKKKYSGGGVIYRYNFENKLEFLLVKIIGGNWGFPKGHIEELETSITAAIREIKEETNIDVEIIAENNFSPEITYIASLNELKYVKFYLAKAKSFDIKLDSDEIAEYKWCKYNEALKLLTYSSQREVLIKARLYIF